MTISDAVAEGMLNLRIWI